MDFFNEKVTTGSRIRCGIRWILGLFLIYLCGKELFGTQGESYAGVFGKALFAFAKGIAGVILLAPDLVMFFSRPILNWIDSIYLPADMEDKPPLDYKLADYYRETRQTEKALERYREIVRFYPKEARAWAWLYLLLREEGSKKEASRVVARARRRLSCPRDWESFRDFVRERIRH